MESLAQYDFEIKHRPGKQMNHVDFLSREITRENTPEPEASTSYHHEFSTPPEVPDEFLDEVVEQEEAITNSRWEEVNFSCQGWNTYPCQTRKQNPRYYTSSTACTLTDHHSHWYCMNCKYCYNPIFWKPQPPEDAECYCNMENNQDESTETESSSSRTDWINEMSDDEISTRNISPLPVDNPNDEQKHWTIYTPAYVYEQPTLNRQYADYMCRITYENPPNSSTENNFETDDMCFLCHKHVPITQYVHNCTYGYETGQQHAEMRPEHLVNTPWWERRPDTPESSNISHYSEMNSPDFYTSIPYNGPTKWTTNSNGDTYLTDDDSYHSEPEYQNDSPTYTPSSPQPQPWYTDDDWAEYNYHKYINY